MADIPDFEDRYNETEDTIRARYDGNADPLLDKREGSWFQSLTQPVISEHALVWSSMNDMLMTGLGLYAFGIYLDYKVAEVGLVRRSATKAAGDVTFTGDNGTIIPTGTIVSTYGTTVTDPVRFQTIEEGLVASGTATVAVEALDEGSRSNVTASSVTYIETEVEGISSVTNALLIAGGTDVESDDDLRARYRLELQSPQGAGNKADYVRWAQSRSGVGNVTVVPRARGVNTVDVIITDPDNNAAGQAVLDDVQQFLSGPIKIGNPSGAPTVAIGVAGSPNGTYHYAYTYSDGIGETKLSPVSAGVAVVSQKVNVGGITVGPTGTTRRRLYRSEDGAAGPFRWVADLPDNTATTYVDNTPEGNTAALAQSTNSTSSYEGMAPIGADVLVYTPSELAIVVTATVVHETGYSLTGAAGTTATEDLITAALESYINELEPGEDVVYRHLESKFFDVEGVYDLTALTINGGTSNIAVANTQVPVLAAPVLT